MLQQYLPLAVLKPDYIVKDGRGLFLLQQYLPLAVLKHAFDSVWLIVTTLVATVLTACGIET